MTDAKEPAAIAALREVVHPTSVGTFHIVYADILQAWDTLTRERDEALAMLGWTKESSLWQAAAAANQEVGHLRAERDALRTQFASARAVIEAAKAWATNQRGWLKPLDEALAEAVDALRALEGDA